MTVYKATEFKASKQPHKIDQSRIGLNQNLLRILTESQNHHCAYCQGEMIVGHQHRHPTKEHIIMKSEGGEKTIDNLVAVCYWCNHVRDNLPFPMVYALCEAGLWPTALHGQEKLLARKYIMVALAELGFDVNANTAIVNGRYFFPDYHQPYTVNELKTDGRSAIKKKNRRDFINRLSESQNHRCCYCGRGMVEGHDHLHPSIEHVIPEAHGDPAIGATNKVLACRWCNSVRGDVPLWAVVPILLKGMWPSALHGTNVSKARAIIVKISQEIRRNTGKQIAEDREMIQTRPYEYLEACGCW